MLPQAPNGVTLTPYDPGLDEQIGAGREFIRPPERTIQANICRCRRHVAGGAPYSRLKARLKAASDS